jgi:outer membrane protein TolC
VVTVPSIETDPASGSPSLSFEQSAVETPARGFAHYSLGATLQQPLFDGMRSWAEVDKAKAETRSAALEIDETALDVDLQVTQLYYEALKAQQSAEVLSQTVALSEGFLQRAQALYEAGRTQKSEVIAAQVNLGNDRVRLEQQRARQIQAWADLALAIGRDATQPLQASMPSELERASLEQLSTHGSIEELIARAQSSRPAVAKAKTALEISEQEERIAGADRYPTVGVGLSYERSGPSFTGSEGVWGDPSRQYVATAQLGVQWNVFNGRRTSAAEQQAAIGKRRAKLELEQTRRRVGAEVVRAQAELAGQSRAAAIAAESQEKAEEGVRLATVRLDAGATTQLELRDATLKLTEARLGLINARIDLIVARAQLSRAVGEGRPNQ